MKIVYPNKSHFESIVPIIFKNLLKALVPISFEICPPVLTNTKILWKLSIQMKITSNQLFPSSLRIRWKLKSQSSLKSVCWADKMKNLFHGHGWSIQLGNGKLTKTVVIPIIDFLVKNNYYLTLNINWQPPFIRCTF